MISMVVLLTLFQLYNQNFVHALGRCHSVDVLVSSQGGVGSSAFLFKLQKLNITSNNQSNEDGLKHTTPNFFLCGLGDNQFIYSFSPVTMLCKKSQKLMVIVGDVNHTLYSTTKRFFATHINTLRKNIGLEELNPSLTLEEIRALPPQQLAIQHYYDSWTNFFKKSTNVNIKLFTPARLYQNINSVLTWIRQL